MTTHQTIYMNPSMLAWTRKYCGFDVVRVADRLKVSECQILEWERGRIAPTMRQLTDFARMCRVPLLFFFLPQPPTTQPIANEHRRITGIECGTESPEFRFEIREMLLRRLRALRLMKELGQEAPCFRLTAHLSESPSIIGQRLREALQVDIRKQFAWTNEWTAWRSWREAIGRLGVFVFQFSKVPQNEMRGITLPAGPLPVIGVSSKETPEDRTLLAFRELVHLMLIQSGAVQASSRNNTISPNQWLAIERLAESAASHALATDEIISNWFQASRSHNPEIDVPFIQRLARRFFMPPLIMNRRIHQIGYTTHDQYLAWIERWKLHLSSMPPRPGGFATPVQRTLGRAGEPFATLVLGALSVHCITPEMASHYLDLKTHHFDALRERLKFGSPPPNADG